MENYDDPSPVNVGVGHDTTIKELAELIADVVGFQGSIKWDTTKPDGTPRKLLDVSRITEMGWQPEIGLRDGVTATYRWYSENQQV